LVSDPVLEIGSVSGQQEYQFDDLVGAVRLGDGRIVVADRGASELRFFAPDGAFSSTVGREGEGPGEFRRLDYLGAFQSDSLATFDSALMRVQVFSPMGEFVRTIPVESEFETARPDKVIGMVDGSTMAIRFIDFSSGVPNGIVRWPHELVATLDMSSGQLDSIGFFPGSEASVEARPNGGYGHGNYVFGKGNEFSANASRIASIDTESFAVTISDPTGKPTLLIRREVHPPEATQQEFEKYVEGRMNAVFGQEDNPSSEDVDRLRSGLLNLPRSNTLPVLRSVTLDEAGNIWIEPYFHTGEIPPPFQVFQPDGTWLGDVTFPKGLDRGFIQYLAPSLQIGSDFVLGIWKDDLDVQYVRLYELEKE
jgi:hypothetical protein